MTTVPTKIGSSNTTVVLPTLTEIGLIVVDFFLSYTREDNEGGLVADFFNDLSEEIARRTPSPQKQIGYLDVKIEIGSSWSDDLIEALRTRNVFLPFYSPRYFRSASCGKEWWVFAQRIHTYKVATGIQPSSIIPVLWEAPSDVPDLPVVAASLQYTQDDMGELYCEYGLRYIVKLKNHFQMEYQNLVRALAGKIITTSGRYQLANYESDLRFDAATDAFATAEAKAKLSNQTGSVTRSVSGPRHVHLVIAAGTADEMRPYRDLGERYGSTPEDWMPFRPDKEDPIILYAQDVARQQHLVAYPARVDQTLQGRIADAEQQNELVILLVDAWSIRLGSYRLALKPLDDYFSLHTAVLVPLNAADPETAREWEVLQDEVRKLFWKYYRGRSRFFRDGIKSLDDFRRALNEVLVETQQLVFTEGMVARRAVGDEVIMRPTITGPVGV